MPDALRLRRGDDEEPNVGQLSTQHVRRDLYQRIQQAFLDEGMKPHQASRMTWGLLNAFLAWAATHIEDEEYDQLFRACADWGTRAASPAVMEMLDPESIDAIIEATLPKRKRRK